SGGGARFEGRSEGWDRRARSHARIRDGASKQQGDQAGGGQDAYLKALGGTAPLPSRQPFHLAPPSGLVPPESTLTGQGEGVQLLPAPPSELMGNSQETHRFH